MLRLKRQEELLDLLREQRYATVEELSRALYASEATVRRDLQALTQAGLIARTHGGAAILDERNQTLPVELRNQSHAQEKAQIGQAAAALVRDGDVILLDASSTALHAMRFLSARRNLTVITNSMRVAAEAGRQHHRVYCTGGLLLENSDAFAGPRAEECVRAFNADLLLFSSAGVSEEGMISDYSEAETQLRRVMFERARRRIFLFDGSKLGLRFPYNLCHVNDTDGVLSERGLPSGWKGLTSL